MLIPRDLPNCHSYLLRFWQERPLEHPGTWRFSMENTQSGARVGFDSLAELVRFLEEEVRPRGSSRPKTTGTS